MSLLSQSSVVPATVTTTTIMTDGTTTATATATTALACVNANTIPSIQYKLLEDIVDREDQYSQGQHVLKYAAYNSDSDSNDSIITIDQWIQYMSDGQYYEEMATNLTNVIKNCPFDAVRFETKGVNAVSAAAEQFEFVLVKDDRLADFAQYSDKYTFKEKLDAITDNPYGGSFPNLSGDATLVCPKNYPEEDDKNRYGHLAVFLRQAPIKQIQSIWKLVAETYRQQLDLHSSSSSNSSPIWFSTAGGGVRWLHYRFDQYPKYYRYQPYKKKPQF